jgi:uncharacterized membrane protein YfcA
MHGIDIYKSLLAGVIAGLASGFLGVSPGGILVPIISLLLPFSQHLAQAISLIVQAPPTSVSGLSIYSGRGRRVTAAPLILVASGFIAGGPGGAVAAKMCSERELRWMFVGYLLILAALASSKRLKTANTTSETKHFQRGSVAALIGIGIIAGFSSGLLGIGGGLAITALSVVLLRKDQHDAQALSLAVTALPLTLPAAWVYINQRMDLPWHSIGCLVAGLVLGGWIGAIFANSLTKRALKAAFVLLLVAMAAYMAVVASNS